MQVPLTASRRRHGGLSGRALGAVSAGAEFLGGDGRLALAHGRGQLFVRATSTRPQPDTERRLTELRGPAADARDEALLQ